MMKFFTIEWWRGCQGGDSTDAPAAAYEKYLAGIRDKLPPELKKLADEVGLHDAELRRLAFLSEKKELELDLIGRGYDAAAKSYYSIKINLRYAGVKLFESTSKREGGLPGPAGYGDLGYDEIEILDNGFFQHRILFSSGIEFGITFSEFSFSCKKTD